MSRPSLIPTIGTILAIAGCATAPSTVPPPIAPQATHESPAPPKSGAYYKDDGPETSPPPNLNRVPDAQPKPEPLHRYANRPYTVFGKNYIPSPALAPYKARGIASWYGKRFHGQPTSSGERYDMYAMTAAHPTLPIPSYARVTRLSNNKSVVVRINDRGPFHGKRLIDLSYTAAHRLGYIADGSARVEVETILPNQAPAVEVAKAPPAAPVEQQVPTATGIYLQLGAFNGRDKADSLATNSRKELGSLGETLAIVFKDGLYRVQAGPYRDENAAREAAQTIKSRVNLNPLLTVR